MAGAQEAEAEAQDVVVVVGVTLDQLAPIQGALTRPTTPWSAVMLVPTRFSSRSKQEEEKKKTGATGAARQAQTSTSIEEVVEAGVLALVWTLSCFLFSHISFLPLSVPFIPYFV